MEFDTYLYTNPGSQQENEDSAIFSTKGEHGIFIVADGLGGHRHGRLASQCVTSSLSNAWTLEETENRAIWLNQQIQTANEKLLTLQKEYHARLKSTVVVLAIDKAKAVWAHTGDSRLYYLHDRTIRHITADHSVSYKKYKAGEITRTQINQDADQSCLLRSLGGEDRFQPELSEASNDLEPGDGFLLCSDGIWKYLYDEEVLIDLLKAGTAQEWAELLLLRVISRIQPETDNLTLMTILLQ